MSGDDHHTDDPHGYGHDEPEVCIKVGIMFICAVVAMAVLTFL
jgi:hypothetical protein